MRKMNGNGHKIKVPTWKDVVKAAEFYGWFTEHVSKDRVILERGRQRIVARKIPGTNKWKVEYFSGNIMDDTTGTESEFFAKKLFGEMFVLK